jgi:hypothetical protein
LLADLISTLSPPVPNERPSCCSSPMVAPTRIPDALA